MILTINTVNAVEHSKCKYLSLAKFEECKDMQHLYQFFQDVLDKGGEGIILRDPNSPYKPGRSQGYLKHKVTFPSLLPPPPSLFILLCLNLFP